MFARDGAHRPNRGANQSRRAAAPPRPLPRSPALPSSPTGRPTGPSGSYRHPTASRKREEGTVRCSVDVRPAPIALEDDLARVAPENDLQLAAADGGGVPAADRARGGLVHVRGGQRIDFDLETAAFLRHILSTFG